MIVFGIPPNLHQKTSSCELCQLSRSDCKMYHYCGSSGNLKVVNLKVVNFLLLKLFILTLFILKDCNMYHHRGSSSVIGAKSQKNVTWDSII